MVTERLFPLVRETRTRGQIFKCNCQSLKTERRRNLFFQMVAGQWNSLPWRLVEAESLNIFKAELRMILD